MWTHGTNARVSATCSTRRISFARSVELGDIGAGLRHGREDPTQSTICDLTGLGVQDVAVAGLVMERVGDRGDFIDPES